MWHAAKVVHTNYPIFYITAEEIHVRIQTCPLRQTTLLWIKLWPQWWWTPYYILLYIMQADCWHRKKKNTMFYCTRELFVPKHTESFTIPCFYAVPAPAQLVVHQCFWSNSRFNTLIVSKQFGWYFEEWINIYVSCIQPCYKNLLLYYCNCSYLSDNI
jgi:hypothetical protein